MASPGTYLTPLVYNYKMHVFIHLSYSAYSRINTTHCLEWLSDYHQYVFVVEFNFQLIKKENSRMSVIHGNKLFVVSTFKR